MSDWVPAGTVDEVVKKKKVVVPVDGVDVLVIVHDGSFFAFQNMCVHRDRELSKGVILNGKLICPGHQWAFALDTGYESIKELCQPTFDVRVHDGVVEVGARRSAGGVVGD